MISNGNSFGLPEGNAYANGNSRAIQDPETTERLGDPLMWGWTGFQKAGNAP